MPGMSDNSSKKYYKQWKEILTLQLSLTGFAKSSWQMGQDSPAIWTSSDVGFVPKFCNKNNSRCLDFFIKIVYINYFAGK